MKKYLFILALLFLPAALSAATFTVSAKTGTETVNAVEGTLVLPSNIKVAKISTGGSTVLIWISPPEWDEAQHAISFAGLTPGGFSGTRPLFELELSGGEPRAAGGVLYGYRNDGEGTQIVLEYELAPAAVREDRTWPEPFTPVISSSRDVLGGAKFVSFLAQDKGTGIDHYEYASSWILPPSKSSWKRAVSPQPLSGVELFKSIRIRAYDGAGYYREEAIPGPYRRIALGAGILLVCLLFFAKRFLRRA